MQSRTENPALSEFDIHLSRLRIRYLETVAALLASIEAVLRHCEDGALEDSHRAELRAISHRLSGTGKTYGFPAISSSARSIDHQLKEQPDVLATDLMQLIYPLVVACRNALGRDEIRGVRPPRTQFGLRRTVYDTPVTDVAYNRQPMMLVVDDDPVMRDLFTDLFSDDALVLTAVNSDEALMMLRRHRFSLVLLDDIMPGAVTGLKFLEILQKSGEFTDTLIIMITASDAPEHIERGLNAGAAAYITKPFDPDEVAVTVRRFLEKSHY